MSAVSSLRFRIFFPWISVGNFKSMPLEPKQKSLDSVIYES